MHKLHNLGRPLGPGQPAFNRWVEDSFAAIQKAAQVPEPATDIVFTAAAIAAVGNRVNTLGKFAGRQVYDSTNNRLMVASGPLVADPWYVADGSASVTPA
jgi:hypothetical protein